MKRFSSLAFVLIASVISTAAVAGCRQWWEPMPPEVGGGFTMITVCCDDDGENCEVYCQDFPIVGDPACPNCP